MNKRYNVVGVGGTFDELHKGHRILLMKAFEVSKHVSIGLCTDEFAKKLIKNHEVTPYKERLAELKLFLLRMNLLHRSDIIPIDDPYGTAIMKNELEAIVVSRETEPVAQTINRIRNRKGLIPLKIFAIDMIPAENHVSISTTRIRHSEIDREGRVLKKQSS